MPRTHDVLVRTFLALALMAAPLYGTAAGWGCLQRVASLQRDHVAHSANPSYADSSAGKVFAAASAHSKGHSSACSPCDRGGPCDCAWVSVDAVSGPGYAMTAMPPDTPWGCSRSSLRLPVAHPPDPPPPRRSIV
jgi:hypothetical protein